MKKTHAKSACCSARVNRFGGRRRQCRQCLRTWRIRTKHRGRKRHRASSDFVLKYLDCLLPSFYALEKRQKGSADVLEYRLKQSRDWFVRQTPWPKIPSGRLVAVADAKMKIINGVMHTVYLILLRSVDGNQAVPFPPIIEVGTESFGGWTRAFDSLPVPVAARIRALVGDGHRGLVFNARWRNWPVQRCHFHLLKSLMVRRSRKSTRGNKEVGRQLITLANILLTTTDQRVFTATMNELEAIGWAAKRGSLRAIITGFLNHLDEYRTYLIRPDLRLPRTSNTAEAFISGLQKLCAGARGFRTRASFEGWVEAYVKHRKSIACNPSSINQIN